MPIYARHYHKIKTTIFMLLLAVLIAFPYGSTHTASADTLETVASETQETNILDIGKDIYKYMSAKKLNQTQKRVLKNMTRVSMGGKALSEKEAYEIINHVVNAAAQKFDVVVECVKVTPGFRDYFFNIAACHSFFDESDGKTHARIYFEADFMDEVLTDATMPIRLCRVLAHEVSHGIETIGINNELSVSGLMFQMYYTAKANDPEYADIEYRQFALEELMANSFAYRFMHDEYLLKAEALGYLNDETTELKTQFLNQSNTDMSAMLVKIFPDISHYLKNSSSTRNAPLLTAMAQVLDSGQATLPDVLQKLCFDAEQEKCGIPSFGEFVKRMDSQYDFRRIKEDSETLSVLAGEESVMEVKVAELKAFVLTAPYLLGISDAPYYDYEQYLSDITADSGNLSYYDSFDDVFVPDWIKNISNKEFLKIIQPYL